MNQRGIFLTSSLAFFLTNIVFAQENKSYDYLINCFRNSKMDTAEIEISGMGLVKTIDFNSNELNETGLTYYIIPKSIQNRSSSKLSDIAAGRHIETWKNNSSVIKKDKHNFGGTSVIDLRLHLLIENIYLQIIVISNKDKMYEIMCFRDNNDQLYFDSLTNKIMERSCLQ